ncbi:Crp/Fnr family transcriptional regulator [Gulosibacter sp. 10]|uniref:Crp/Fnr family transcriptional regulator n=1 Tax=Gulosibacter sp. 10 TaxID=1255570 RepID=UPI00097EF423|nr:Crp/Fnr family transcriptional regulator [Gulosibacter sp. 10]SJM66474.1 Hcp transcriptional regulator HcpR (Crp/Fnr family) [Gulosibacter sp. 10]
MTVTLPHARTEAPEPRAPGWREGELFAGITEEDFACVRHCLRASVVEFERHDLVLSHVPGRQMIGVMLSGVGLDRQGREDGTGVLVDVVEPGDLFGDGWGELSGAQAREVSAASACTAVLLDATRLVEGHSACAVRPRLVDNFLVTVLRKQLRLRDHFDLMTRRSLRDRLLAYLRSQAERAGRSAFAIPLSRAELAEYLHADRTAVSRELTRMQREGLLEYQRNRFRLIVDR